MQDGCAYSHHPIGCTFINWSAEPHFLGWGVLYSLFTTPPYRWLTAATLRGKVGQNAMAVDKSIYDYLIYDSDGEQKFAEDLDINQKVALYVKLPKSFFISTPVGKYSPDWAIAFHEGAVKHVYFVAETKGSNDTMELRGVENAKIECAKAHFAAISNNSVTYDVVSNFGELINLVS